MTGHTPPVSGLAVFSATPTSGPVLLRVQCTDQCTGAITSRLWAFGNGATSTATHPA
jgi:PKD repeat protein